MKDLLDDDKFALDEVMAGGIIHEINHPIAWILANLNFVKERIQELQANMAVSRVQQHQSIEKKNLYENIIKDLDHSLLPQLVEVLDESIEGAEQIQDVMHNLRRFARLQENEKAVINIHDVITDILKLASFQFNANIKIEKIFSDHIPPLKLHNRKLHQLFLNLIINAAQSFPEKGTKKNIIRIKTSLENGRLRIDVCDSGIGMSPQSKENNLVVCQEIVDQLGGEWRVESTLGSGNVITVYLPLDAKACLGNENGDAMATRRLRILAIDDKPSLLKTVQRMVEPHHDVASMGSGRAALALLIEQADNFDVIICDAGMSDISGADLYRFLIDKHSDLVQKLIFIVSDIDAPRMKEFVAMVSNPCIQIPFTKEELLEAIGKITRVSSAESI